MTLKTRLHKAEVHPTTEVAKEMKRLRTQEAKPLFEVAFAFQQAHPDDALLRLVEMTDAQLMRLLLDSELTPQQRQEYEQAMQNLLPLQEQAKRNVDLMKHGRPADTLAELLSEPVSKPSLTPEEEAGYAAL